MDKITIEYITNNLNSGYSRKEPWTEEEINSLKKALKDVFDDEEEVFKRMNCELGISKEEYYEIMKNKEHEHWPKMTEIIKDINLNR